MAKKNNALLVTEGSYANGDLELRKHNDAVALRVVKGNLSLYDRRAFNAACAHAQRQGVPGINAPLDSPASKSYFWMRYTDVSKDIGGNREAIKKAFDTLADVEVVAESDREWTSERMISGVKFFNSHGLKNKGGTLWIGISFPPEVQEMVLRPSTYTKFSLLYQTVLTKNHSMGLYEILRRYATSPAHLTIRAPVEWWYSVITGNPITDPQPVYKYMKRDTFLPALKECNDVTDIEASMIEFKLGRRIVELQFKVHLKNQKLLPLESLPTFDVSLLDRVMKLGLTQDEAKSAYSTYGEALLAVTVEYVEARLKSKKGTTLASPVAYFKTALKDGYAKEMLNKPLPAAKLKNVNAKGELRERFIAARSLEAMRYYEELDEIEQKKLLDEFMPEVTPAIRKYIKKTGLEMKVVKSAFGEWIANKVWGEPTDAMILDFIEAEEVQIDGE